MDILAEVRFIEAKVYLEETARRQRRIGRAHVRSEANRVRRELGQTPVPYGSEARIDAMTRMTDKARKIFAGLDR